MKCPKCGYVSFDYNQVCPKCSKDIGTEQQRLNLPAFKPDPPYLLEALTGAASASRIGLEAVTLAESPGMDRVIGVTMDHTGVKEKTPGFGKKKQGFEIEHQDPESPEMELGEANETDISAVDLSKIEMESSEEGHGIVAFDLEDVPDAVEISEQDLKLDDVEEESAMSISSTAPEMEEEAFDKDSKANEGEEIFLDLDEISDERLEAAMALEKENTDLSLDLEDLAENGQDLDEISLEPGKDLERGLHNLPAPDWDDAGGSAAAEEVPYNETEMLTVELDSGKRKQPDYGEDDGSEP